MNKALWAVMTMLLLALASLGLLARHQAVQIGVLKADAKTATEALSRAAVQRQLDASTIAAWQAQKRATALKSAQAQQGAQKALSANPVWSEADVPADVQSSLSARFGGSKSAPR